MDIVIFVGIGVVGAALTGGFSSLLRRHEALQERVATLEERLDV